MDPIERKTSIINAAVRRFASAGYHRTQISDIIEEAGVARGTFYLYFKGKHDVFVSILDEFISQLASQITSIDLESAMSPALQMRKNVERVVDAILARPELGRILFNEAVGLDEAVHEKLRSFYETLIAITRHSIARGISKGLVRSVDPTVAACIALGSVRELFMQRDVFKNASLGRNAIVNGLIDVLFGGLGEKLIANQP